MPNLSEAERRLLSQEPRPDERPHVRAARAKHRRAYAGWGRIEENLLVRLSLQGEGHEGIARVVERQPQAVKRRLEKLEREFGTLTGAAARLARALGQPLNIVSSPPALPASDCPYCSASVPSGARNCPTCGTPQPRPAALSAPVGHNLPVGSTLQGGKYSVGRVLGEGGFGITYQGANVALRQRVAIKELFPAGASRQGRQLHPPRGSSRDHLILERAKFVAEARTVARFAHPAIVRVLDAFEENDTAYMVMEYLDGETLRDRVTREGPLAPGVVGRLARELLGALAAVHAEKVLHRDIKPDNVMLCGERAVLIDFGAARDFAAGRTQQHSVVLTPGFAPLEQYARSARRGPFTDLYSLGGTLYYALTGSEPTPATERAGGAEMPPLPKGLRGRAPALAGAVEAALALRVEERPQSAGEMLALLGGKPPGAPAPRPAPAVAKPPQPMPAPRGAPPKPPTNPTPAAQAQFMDKLIRWLRGL